MEAKCIQCGKIRKRDYVKEHTKAGQLFLNSICNACHISNNITGIKKSESAKQKISDAKIGIKRPDWVRNKLSIGKKGKYTGNENHFYNKTHTQQSKQLMSEKALLKNAKKYGYQTIDEYINSKPDRNKYYSLVWKLTKQHDLTNLSNYDKLAENNTAGNIGAYHLDHIYPINLGYINNIPAELIASIENLRYIPWKDNQIKQDKIESIPKNIQTYLESK